jgi:hypothetical protein
MGCENSISFFLRKKTINFYFFSKKQINANRKIKLFDLDKILLELHYFIKKFYEVIEYLYIVYESKVH